jgi:hypothetical protein
VSAPTKETVVDSNINDLMKISDTYDDSKDMNNENSKPEKQRKKKVRKDIELLTSLINSQT